jgi:hypothetical protein
MPSTGIHRDEQQLVRTAKQRCPHHRVDPAGKGDHRRALNDQRRETCSDDPAGEETHRGADLDAPHCRFGHDLRYERQTLESPVIEREETEQIGPAPSASLALDFNRKSRTVELTAVNMTNPAMART